MEEAGFEEMGANVLRRRNMVTQYIAERPIMCLCKKTVQSTGGWVSRRWWEQEGLDLSVEKPMAAETLDGE